MSKIENIFKKVNINNIQNLKKDDFLSAFLVGHDLYEDYIYLKKDLPEMVDSLDLEGTWKDYQGDTKIFNKNGEYFLGRNVKGSVYLLGEAKFLDNGNLDWIRYSEDFRFSMGDYLFCRNGKGYKGTLPEEERPHSESLESYYLFFENAEGDRIEYNLSRYSSDVEISFKKNSFSDQKILKMRISLLNNEYVAYLMNELNEHLEVRQKDDFLDKICEEISKSFIKNSRKVNACIGSFEHIKLNYDSILHHLTK